MRERYGFFFDENGENTNKCVPCPSLCYHCYYSTECIECEVGYGLEYKNGAVQSNCVQCPPNCITCRTTKECEECKPGYFLYVNYTDDSTLCQKCSEHCRNCSNLRCNECEENYHVSLRQDDSFGLCLSENEVPSPTTVFVLDPTQTPRGQIISFSISFSLGWTRMKSVTMLPSYFMSNVISYTYFGGPDVEVNVQSMFITYLPYLIYYLSPSYSPMIIEMYLN